MADQSSAPVTARFKLTSILSFIAFVAIYSAASGVKFGIGFAVLILIHEMGHFIDIKRRGLPADMPVFLPGLGAYVRWQALGVPLETRAQVSLAGPLAGFLASLACAALWWQTGNPLWAALARVGAILNLLNLIPVWVLDGGQAALALSKAERIVLMTAGVALGLVLRAEHVFPGGAGGGISSVLCRRSASPSQPRHDDLLCRGADGAGCDHPAHAGTGIGTKLILVSCIHVRTSRDRTGERMMKVRDERFRSIFDCLPALVLVVTFCGAPTVFAGEPQWVEVRSPNFSVVTDAGEKRGREVAMRFEQMRAVFGDLDHEGECELPVPLQIVAFRNTKEMRQVAPLFQRQTDATGRIVSGRQRPQLHHARHVGGESLGGGVSRIRAPTHEWHAAGGNRSLV